MAGLNIETAERLNFINKLYILNLSFVVECSESVYNSLKIAWSNYTNVVNSINKRTRNLDKIYKNLEKLKNIEIKKISLDKLSSIKDKNIKYINEIFNKDIINIKYKRKIVHYMRNFESLSEIMEYLIKIYIDLEKKTMEKKEEKDETITLPKIKKNHEYKISYVIDKNNYLYSNVILENGAMIFDKKSFMQEKKKYKYALKSMCYLFDKVDDNVKLSPFEKKRRIYIQSMFDLESNLINLSKKKLDITYPIEKYFLYSRYIVEYIYKDVTDFKLNKNSVLNYMMDLTKETYGCNKLISKYDIISIRFNNDLKEVDRYIVDELVRDSNNIKNNDYIEFKNIGGIIPSIIDIYGVINNKIKRNVGVFLKDYLKNIKNNMNLATRYMSIADIVDFYREIKNVLLRDYRSYGNRTSDYIIEIQRVTVKILSNRLNKDENVILSEYLKEERFYKV